MTASYSICGKKMSEEDLRQFTIRNDTVTLVCQMVRKRLKSIGLPVEK